MKQSRFSVLGKCLSLVLSVLLLFTMMPLSVFSASAATVEDYSDQLVFGSNGTITRAEWVHNLVVVFGMSTEKSLLPDNYFTDIKETDKYYQDILLAVEYGAIDIEPGLPFNPNNAATRDFAASTLNHCLGFQEVEGESYSFSDADSCTSPLAAQVMVEKGWLSLANGQFCGNTNVTTDEVKAMLNGALALLEQAEADPNHINEYTFADDVIEVPDGTPVVEQSDGVFAITNAPAELVAGCRFAVYFNHIPLVYTADEVKTVGNITTVKATREEDDSSAFTDVDAVGEIGFNDVEIIPEEGVTMNVVNEEQPTQQSRGMRKRDTLYLTTINLDKDFEILPGVSVSLAATIRNPRINYATDKNYARVDFSGDCEIEYGLSGNLTQAAGFTEVKLATINILYVGSLDVKVVLDLSGKISGVVKGYLNAGVECRKGDRIRAIKNFNMEDYFNKVEAEASIGLRVDLGVRDLPCITAEIYAEIGAKATLNTKIYKDGSKPERCSHYRAYLYAKYGGDAGIDLGVWSDEESFRCDIYSFSNSPIKVEKHYDDGVQVSKCSRGTTFRYYTGGYSRFAGSGASWESGLYGLDAEGNLIELYDWETYEDEDLGVVARIKKYNGKAYNVQIPEEIEGYSVASIEGMAFSSKDLVRVKIPDSVRHIHASAFANCKNLSEVTMSKNVVYIGAAAFESTAITSIHIPKSLEYVGNTTGWNYNFNGNSYYIPRGPFVGCENLKTVTFEEGRIAIPDDLFAGCVGLREITIPDTITEIGWSSFEAALRLEKINFSQYLSAIKYQSFKNCVSLTSLTIPDSVTDIGGGAFMGCTSVTEVILPQRLDYLGEEAFAKTAISEIRIPKSLETAGGSYQREYVLNGITSSIRNGPFYLCENLKTVTFEGERTAIPGNLFAGAVGLEEITLPASVVDIDSCAFDGAVRLKSVKGTENVDTIGNGVFANCVSMTTTPNLDKVTWMGEGCFEDCTALTTVTFSSKFNKVPDRTFQGTKALKKVSIPAHITVIGDQAFFQSGVETVAFDKDSQLDTIGGSAFCQSGLTEIELPTSLRRLDSLCFSRSTNLKKVTLPRNLKMMENSVFRDCSALTEVVFADYSLEEIPNEAFYNCTALNNVVLPKGLVTVGYQGFYNNAALTAITIPQTVEEIDSTAFSYAAKMTITGVAGSYAETFAEEENIKFVDKTVPAAGLALADEWLEYNDYFVVDSGDTLPLTFMVLPEDTTDIITLTQIDGDGSVDFDGLDIKCSWSGDAVVQAATTSGATYEFTVHVRSVEEIVIKNPADKLTYALDEKLDTTGLVVEAHYDDGTVADVTADCTFEGFDSTAEGECTVTVIYEPFGWSWDAFYTVQVIDSRPKLTGITLVAPPQKVTYLRGEAIDTTGMVVSGKYSDGTEKTITDYTLFGYNALKLGEQTVQVKYEDFAASFIVQVLNIQKPTINPELDAKPLTDALLAATAMQQDGKVYTTDTQEALSSALQAANALTASSTEEQVSAAVEALQNAVANASFKQGDVNGDGGVTVADALSVLQNVTGKVNLSGAAVKTADANGDGNVTVSDALLILQVVTGKVDFN